MFGERIPPKVASARPGRRAGNEPTMALAIYVGHHGRSGALLASTEFGEVTTHKSHSTTDVVSFEWRWHVSFEYW